MKQDEAARIADALDEAVRHKDSKALRALYSDDAVVWHAATNREQSPEENVSMLAAMWEITDIQYADVRRHFIEGGFVQQHRLMARYVDGGEIPDVHACAVVKVSNNKIVRLDEYFDMSAVKDHWLRLSQRAATMRNAAQA